MVCRIRETQRWTSIHRAKLSLSIARYSPVPAAYSISKEGRIMFYSSIERLSFTGILRSIFYVQSPIKIFLSEISSSYFREEWKSCNTFQYFLFHAGISFNQFHSFLSEKDENLAILFNTSTSSSMQEFCLINFISSKFWTNLNYRKESTINYYPSSLHFLSERNIILLLQRRMKILQYFSILPLHAGISFN